MKQENRNLLLQDLCGRLPYGVKIKEQDGDYTDVNIHNAYIEHLIDRVGSGLDKMVLRPLSSMTEEEDKEYIELGSKIGFPYRHASNLIDWLNKHHFDYRGLIEKGLALEAPEGMYNN